MTRKLTVIRSSWMDYRDVLEAGEDFDTSGSLRGRREGWGASLVWGHRLPAEYHASARAADYVVYSYATPIAWRTQGQWVTPDVKYSVTTSRQQSTVFTAIAELR